MRNAMRWLIVAVMMTAGMQAAHAELIDPMTGITVNATSDPMDYMAVASGQPGDFGTEAAAQAEAAADEAEAAAAQAAAQAEADAQAAANQ